MPKTRINYDEDTEFVKKMDAEIEERPEEYSSRAQFIRKALRKYIKEL